MKRTLIVLGAMSIATFALAQAPKGQAPQGQAPQGQQQAAPQPPKPPTPAEVQAAVKALHACINLKSPEGEPPKEGTPEHEKMMKDAEGGPQSCVGSVIETCQKDGASEETCALREGQAWLAATALDKETEKKIGAKNVGVYRAAASKILPNAIALCKSAAAVSAWGADAIRTNSRDLVFDITQPCVFDAVVQQSLIILVNKRGG